MTRRITREAICSHCKGAGWVLTTQPNSTNGTEICILCNGNKTIIETVIEQDNNCYPNFGYPFINPFNALGDPIPPTWTLEESRNKTNQS